MTLLKKLNTLFLTTCIITAFIFGFSSNSSYAATSYKKDIEPDITYKYDLDGDGDKDTIKVYQSNQKLLLKVNNCTKTLISDYSYMNYDYEVQIYDFNTKDKSSEIVFQWMGEYEDYDDLDFDDFDDFDYDDSDFDYLYYIEGNYGTRILKFQNNTCKVNKHYYHAYLENYDPNTGMVKFFEDEQGSYNKFLGAIGCFDCYSKIKVNGYKISAQYTANTTSDTKENRYVAAKNLTAYKSVNSSKKAFTIKKNSSVRIYALYKKGNTRYIKVKNSSGKYGYVKAGSSLLFKESSCLWW